MPVLPEFSPQGSPTSVIDSFAQGVTARNSWMDSATRRRMQEQQMQHEQELFDLQRPIRQQEQEVQLLALGNQLTGAKQMNTLLGQAQTEMPQIRQAWIDAMTQNDPNVRLQRMEQVLGAAGKYGSLKEVAPEIDQWKNVYAQQHLDKRANDALTGKRDIEEMKKAYEQQIASFRIEAQAAADRARAEERQKLQDERQKWMEERIRLQGQQTTRTQSDVSRNQGAYKVNNDTIAAGSTAMRDSVNLQRGIELLADPEVRTGTGAGLQVKLQRLGQALGIDTKGIAQTEQLQQILGDAVLARVNQTKGSISDKEMALFDAYSASLNKTAEGNTKILQALLRVKQRDVEIAKMVNDLRRKGEDEFQIQTAVDDYRLTHNIWDGLTPPTADTDQATTTGSQPAPLKILSIKPITR